MARPTALIIETDGASRGNPGLAGAGVIIKDGQGNRIRQIAEFLGSMTNNQAEYRALIIGLKAAAEMAPEQVTVRMDSELVVRQMNGQYKVRNPSIVPLYLQAVEAATVLRQVTIEHVPREENPGADQVANLAIDGRMTRGRGAAPEAE
jgi:ribonuclease HI